MSRKYFVWRRLVRHYSVEKGRFYDRVGESVEYNGVRFYRYPNSTNRSHRNYYTPGIQAKQNGVDLLHRQIWKDHFGEIPEGYLIHHKDENPLNNELSNLECITTKQHFYKHPDRIAYCNSQEQLDHLARIRDKTKSWHSSKEGIKWHVQHAKEMRFGQHEFIDVQCFVCGKQYQTKHKSVRNYCSKECTNAQRRADLAAGKRNIHYHQCEYCSKTFVTPYKNSRFCSRSCAGRKDNTEKFNESL